MSAKKPTSLEAKILDRLIEPTRPSIPEQEANWLLSLRFGKKDMDRMNRLAEKARDGSLSPAEEIEIRSYERVGHFVGLVQSKARQSLKKATKK